MADKVDTSLKLLLEISKMMIGKGPAVSASVVSGMLGIHLSGLPREQWAKQLRLIIEGALDMARDLRSENPDHQQKH